MAEKRTVSEALEQAARELEAEVKRAVEYIETNIVPKARGTGQRSRSTYGAGLGR
jgi:hypothetical protein